MIRHILALVACVALSLSTVACAAQNEEAAAASESSDQDLVAQSAKFEIFVGADGDYYFRMVAANGENVLQSEGYTTRAGAQGGIDSVVENAPDTRNVEILQATDGQWYFTVKAGNTQVIGVSEMYSTKSNAERGARTVRALSRQLRNGEG